MINAKYIQYTGEERRGIIYNRLERDIYSFITGLKHNKMHQRRIKLICQRQLGVLFSKICFLNRENDYRTTAGSLKT
jgi:hypothetical protein